MENNQLNLKLKKELDWLQKLNDGLRTLKPEQFKYSQFISESHDDCGTVCCAYGWMPKFVPESGVKWELDDDYLLINVTPHEKFKSIKPLLIYFMFYGHRPQTSEFISFFDNEDIDCGINSQDQNLYCTLEQVINRIELVIKYLKQR